MMSGLRFALRISLCLAIALQFWRPLRRPLVAPVPNLIRPEYDDQTDAQEALEVLLRQQDAIERPLRDKPDFDMTATHGPAAPYAWECHSAILHPEYVPLEFTEFLRDNVVFGVITGKSYSERVQTSLCSWMAHLPVENIILFTDDPQPRPHPTPRGTLYPIPYNMTSFYEFHFVDIGTDIISPFYVEGYYSSMVNQQRKTNYPLGWVKAQYRFGFALYTLTRPENTNKFKYHFLLDDDTFVNWNALVPRLQQLDHTQPVYLNSQGWGGSGHLLTRAAAQRLHPKLKGCVYDYMIKRWGSSDGMLMKCVQHAGLQNRNEPNFQWCGARAVAHGFVPGGGPDALDRAITIHAKIEYRTPPDEFRKWRIQLHYQAMTGRNRTARRLLLQVSSCGMCEVAKNRCKYHEQSNADPFEIFRNVTRYAGALQ
eukprot:TRINITY_DN82523_c0_g1_i1.p1 TRINITY_DN82523_c0_g1~~TRINITY_DN82523_c0_g1_i1.p1  ORF type:complete len:449 (-),score=45.67 TRINITY_DN82523_c0_g1_i1:39-1316(-)